MADLNPFINYGAAMRDAAEIPGAIAKQWAERQLTQSQSRLTEEEASKLALRNKITRMKMPLLEEAFSGGLGGQNYDQGSPVDSLYASPKIDKDVSNASSQGTATEDAPQSALGPGTEPSAMAPSEAVARDQAATAKAQTPKEVRRGKIEASVGAHAVDTLAPIPEKMPAFLPNGKPNPQFKLVQALTLSGDPEDIAAAEGLMSNWESNAKSENQRREKLANRSTVLAMDIAGVPPDRAWAVLEHQSSEEAKKIRAAHPGMSGEDLQEYFQAIAGASHPFSKRGVAVRDDGYVVDAPTGKRIPGYDYRVGMSAAQEAEFRKSLVAPTYTFNMDGGQVTGSFLTFANSIRKKGQGPITADQAYEELTREAAKTGQTQQEIMDTRVREAGGVRTTPPAPKTPVVPAAEQGSTVSSTNSPVGGFDLSGFTKTPEFYKSGLNRPITEGERRADANYRDSYNSMRTEFAADSTKSSVYIANNQKMLQTLKSTTTGPLSGWEAKVKNFMAEFGGPQAEAIITSIKSGDPAAWDILNKLTTEGAVGKVTGAADQTRISAALYQFGTNIFANPSQNRRAMEALLKYDIAWHEYNKKMLTDDYRKVDGKVDIRSYTNEYMQQNSPALVLPRLVKSMTSEGEVNYAKGTPINPHTPKTPDDLKDIPSGQYFRTPDGRVGPKK